MRSSIPCPNLRKKYITVQEKEKKRRRRRRRRTNWNHF
jgi:hypothetical protein